MSSRELHIKRPLNSFLVFSRDERPKIAEELGKHHHTMISRELGIRWKALTPEEKQPYVQEAKRLKEELMLKHPDYKYAPNKKKKQQLKDSTAPYPATTSRSAADQMLSAAKERVRTMQQSEILRQQIMEEQQKQIAYQNNQARRMAEEYHLQRRPTNKYIGEWEDEKDTEGQSGILPYEQVAQAYADSSSAFRLAPGFIGNFNPYIPFFGSLPTIQPAIPRTSSNASSFSNATSSASPALPDIVEGPKPSDLPSSGLFDDADDYVPNLSNMVQYDARQWDNFYQNY